ncbi:hypothetical protein J6590_003704 [Homalodisca vitripennis]|nr:hypothetical protein J6590_003704 [Homalodisca vitripennis]
MTKGAEYFIPLPELCTRQSSPSRPREGRTPLHYCGRCRDPDWMWSTLRQAGADAALLDLHGRTPTYYMEHPQEAKLPTTPNNTPGGRFTSGGNGKLPLHLLDIAGNVWPVWMGRIFSEICQSSALRNSRKVSRFTFWLGLQKNSGHNTPELKN